jgi:signal transduction histidine kinase
MTVSQRLYLAVVPAILGVFTVAGLAYWGQYDRQAPHVLVIVGVIASVGSLVVAWRNTRYVATRVTRLAASGPESRHDELDVIEQEVDRLRRAVAGAEAAQAGAQQRAEASVREYGTLVSDAAMAAARQLDEIRMPLHILLENRFGDLNDNQEEMLASARTAADDAQASLERLRQVADIDRGTLRMRAERLRLTDLVAALLPGLAAEGARGSVAVSADLSPWLPAVSGDRALLGQALSLLTGDAVRRTPAGGAVRITGGDTQPTNRAGAATPAVEPGAPAMVQLIVSHGALPGRMTDIALADRLITALGGRVQHGDDRTEISLPVAPVGPGSALEPENASTPIAAADRDSVTS